MTVPRHLGHSVEHRLTERGYIYLASTPRLSFIRGLLVLAGTEPRQGHGSPAEEPWHNGLVHCNLPFYFGLEIDLENSRVIAHCSARFLSGAVGLVLSCRWLCWGYQATVSSGQCLTHSHDGRLSIALKDKSVLGPARVAPGLKLLVHIFHQPTLVTFSS